MTAEREGMWMERTPGTLADLDQIRAELVDRVRAADIAIVCTKVGDDFEIGIAGDGIVGETSSFFVASLVEVFDFVAEATGNHPLALWALICNHYAAKAVAASSDEEEGR